MVQGMKTMKIRFRKGACQMSVSKLAWITPASILVVATRSLEEGLLTCKKMRIFHVLAARFTRSSPQWTIQLRRCKLRSFN